MVTGGNSQIATAIKKLNTDLCYEFLCSDDLDICDPHAVDGCFREIDPRIVINTAAYTAVDKAEENPERVYRVNGLGPELLAIACANSKIPLIHLSTDYVFSGDSMIPYTEDSKAWPVCTYGQSKLDGEKAVRALLDEHVILRLSGVFSGYSDCFPRSILKAALQHAELKIVSDQITGPTSADSIALVLDLMVAKIFAGNLNWGIYHFAQQPFLSWYEFGRTIIDIAQKMDSRFLNTEIRPVRSKEFNATAPRPSYACLDSSKLARELCLDCSTLSRDFYLQDAIAYTIKLLRESEL